MGDSVRNSEKLDLKCHASSRPRDLPPQSLQETDVNLSAHPAPIDQPQAVRQNANGQTNEVDGVKYVPTSVLP
jgi:hypothetical protein